MKRVLVYFTEFNHALGGGEYTPLSFIAELQKDCEVVLALNWRSDVVYAAETLKIPIDFSRLRIEYVKPANRFLQKLDAILPFYRTRRLKKLAKQADICISTANMFDFGKPAHHFVFLLRQFGDNAFLEHLGGRPAPTGFARFKRTFRTVLAERFLRPLLGLRSTRKILADRRERIYPNSHYVERVMHDFYGDFNGTVFYPPTVFEFTMPSPARDPLQIVCIGQLFPEKRLLEIIDMVERARGISGLDLKLTLGGSLIATDYVRKLQQVAAERSWMELAGPVYGEAKERFLLSATYAVHAERDEAFGIAITEYLKAGLIPVVPDDGGACEIVDSPPLAYHTIEDGARILARLATDDAFRAEQRQFCGERAKLFTRAAYLENQHRILQSILNPDESKVK